MLASPANGVKAGCPWLTGPIWVLSLASVQPLEHLPRRPAHAVLYVTLSAMGEAQDVCTLRRQAGARPDRRRPTSTRSSPGKLMPSRASRVALRRTRY